MTGLANVSINDDYVLTDKIAPRAFSELTDLDIEIVRVLYMAYAYEQGQNGPIFTGIDEYKVPIIDMFYSCMISMRKATSHWMRIWMKS